MKRKHVLLLTTLIGLIPLLAGLSLGIRAHEILTPFTSNKYDELLSRLENQGYQFILPRDYQPTSNKTAIIIHDVDINTHGLSTFINIETKHRVKSAFYLRVTAEYFTQTIPTFQNIEQQGWEIGLHYDSWSRSYPNMTEAITLFKAQVQYARTFFTISTTRGHGDEYNYNVTNMELYDKHPELWKTLNLRDFTAHPDFNSGISDTNHEWKETSTLGDKIVILLHTDWW